jgi:hypothetical protein
MSPVAMAPLLCCFVAALSGCSDDVGEVGCALPLEFEIGGEGHPDPLATVGPGQARAGRIRGDQLPASPGELAVWEDGDFVLANDRVALVIEDVGASDLYDPWGGRPVGIARVDDGQLVSPANFGEFFILTGRMSVLTQSVSVINDGTNGQAAVIRAAGFPAATPVFEPLIGGLFRDEFGDIPTAIEYVLEPDADHVDIYVVHNSARRNDTRVGVVLHGYMYTPRMPLFAPGLGFDTENKDVPYLGFIDDEATSYAYSIPGQVLSGGIYASGFASNFAEPFEILACAQTRRHHARLTIGGPGLDGLLQAVARTQGTSLRPITGVVTETDGTPAKGVRVHATDEAGGYITRALTDASGAYALHVPDGQAALLTVWRQGDPAVEASAAADQSSVDIQLAPGGLVHVVALDDESGAPLPVRIQILPTTDPVPGVPGYYGEPRVTGGRVHVEYAMDGQATLRLPEGSWEVVVSRGYEYEIYREIVSITAGEITEVQARIEHVVDTTGYMCADFHIHTHRSADSGDDARDKLRSAVAEGLELPVRSEHEYVATFQPLIEELGLADWAFGVGSIEMTSFQAWGHMGVVPLEPDPTKINAGAPLWQRYPSADAPDIAVETLLPPEVFAAVRARPEQPIIIINHPRRSTNYFTVADYDPITGEARRPEYWDEEFSVVEVFNNSGWLANRDETVADWLSLLDHGRRVFAVGSSDSHNLRSSPLGYPRTCLDLGTDDPRALTPEMVRDATGGGHSTISGGIYVYASVNNAGPGEEVIVPSTTATLHVRVEAASWVDVDWLEIVVDGDVIDTIAVPPGDASNPAIRYQADIPIQVTPALGSYVIVAAYGDQPLDPVHPGKMPFGVTNPIFLVQ